MENIYDVFNDIFDNNDDNNNDDNDDNNDDNDNNDTVWEKSISKSESMSIESESMSIESEKSEACESVIKHSKPIAIPRPKKNNMENWCCSSTPGTVRSQLFNKYEVDHSDNLDHSDHLDHLDHLDHSDHLNHPDHIDHPNPNLRRKKKNEYVLVDSKLSDTSDTLSDIPDQEKTTYQNFKE